MDGGRNKRPQPGSEALAGDSKIRACGHEPMQATSARWQQRAIRQKLFQEDGFEFRERDVRSPTEAWEMGLAESVG